MPKENEKKYRLQSYRKEWEKESWAQGWLSVSKKGSSKAHCNFCDRELAVGKSELIAHSKTGYHMRLAKQAEATHKIGTFFETKNFGKMKAELNAVALIARRNLSLNLMDHLVDTLHFIADDSKAIKDMKCGRTKGTYLLTECLSVSAHEALVNEIKSAKGISILCDKATDITMNKTFCVNVRFIEKQSSEPKTLLYRLLSVKADGGAASLFQLLEEALKEDGIPWDKVVGYASDGENLMQGANNSFLTRMQLKVPNLYVLKCFCHSFHLVASHACKTLSKTAEQLVHDLYSYFKNSPNRKTSFEEFQHFFHCEPHKILKPCQTRWLSLSACVNRVLNQWNALEMFFIAEAAELKPPQADRILQSLKSPYIKATLEFMDFVLGDLTGLNVMFQSNEFKLHRFLPEVERVIRMFCANFMVRSQIIDLKDIDLENRSNWLQLEKVYPGILASETIKTMRPHEKEAFLSRCRDWYKEAVHQILARVNISDPILKAVQNIHPSAIIDGKASLDSASVLAKSLPQLADKNLQVIDRQWRSILIDDEVLHSGWGAKSIEEFWRAISKITTYEDLGQFMLQITALPQSTAAVERTFSKVNNNKTKLRSRLAVRTIEAIVRVSERFSTNFEIDEKMANLFSKARSSYMDRYNQSERENAEQIDY